MKIKLNYEIIQWYRDQTADSIALTLKPVNETTEDWKNSVGVIDPVFSTLGKAKRK